MAGPDEPAIHPPGFVVRDTGLSRDDLYRVLPAFLADRPYAIDDEGVIRTPVGAGQVTIRPGPQTERRIAMLRLPAMALEFEFTGCTDSEQAAFLMRFERSYQKGGG